MSPFTISSSFPMINKRKLKIRSSYFFFLSERECHEIHYVIMNKLQSCTNCGISNCAKYKEKINENDGDGGKNG